MLACATSAGEVMLYDITNPRAPRQGFGEEPVATYAARHRGAGASEALAVRFNHVNERILAVGYANGHAHIFDSRKGRAVMEITDESAPRRIAGLAWAPHAQTNLVLASEHDASPTLQFWELRMGKAPKLEYVGHARGVTDVAWCAQEPHVLVSSGKDQRTIVWDAPSGDQLGCLTPSEAGAAIQVRWSLWTPGLAFEPRACMCCNTLALCRWRGAPPAPGRSCRARRAWRCAWRATRARRAA